MGGAGGKRGCPHSLQIYAWERVEIMEYVRVIFRTEKGEGSTHFYSAENLDYLLTFVRGSEDITDYEVVRVSREDAEEVCREQNLSIL